MKVHRLENPIEIMNKNGIQNLFFVSLALMFLMTLLVWIHNRYLPIQEGWIQYYSLLTSKGLFPYKDFYYFTQPIPLFIQQILSEFGDAFIYYRYYGMFERAILLIVVYFLLSREFTPQASFLGTLATIFLFQSYSSDTLYSYHQTTLLLFLLAIVCLYNAEHSSHSKLSFFLAGFLSSLAFFTKQSNGLFVVLIILFLLLWQASRASIISRLVNFGLGFLLPFTLIVGWIVKNNAWQQYLDQVFVGGASSKGSLVSIMFGFVARNNFGLMFLLLSLNSFPVISFE